MALWHGLEVVEEAPGVVVHDEFVGESSLLDEGIEPLVVGNLERDVGVGAEDDGHAVTFAEPEQLNVVRPCHHLVAVGREAVVVDFEQGVSFLGGLYDGLEVEVGGAVAGMADDLHKGIAHGGYHALGVLLPCAALPADAVYAGDAQVEHAQVPLVEVEMALCVEDVDLATEHQPDAVHGAWHDVHVTEVDGVARARDAGAVLGDA